LNVYFIIEITTTFTSNTNTILRTFLVDDVGPLAHLLDVVRVALHVGEDAGLVGPHKVLGAEELHGELAHLVLHSQDVLRDDLGQTHLRGPPPGETRAGGVGQKPLVPTAYVSSAVSRSLQSSPQLFITLMGGSSSGG